MGKKDYLSKYYAGEDDRGDDGDNKSKKKVSLPDSDSEEARADPGFRIFHVDAKTGEKREVPPYTTPGEFLQSLQKENDATEEAEEGEEKPQIKSEEINGVPKEEKLVHNGINGENNESAKSEYSETTYVPFRHTDSDRLQAFIAFAAILTALFCSPAPPAVVTATMVTRPF